MKQLNQAWPSRREAFTLIELLVVIAIIGVLAALIVPIAGALKAKEIKSVAGAQLVQLETAIESYKSKVGYYPPDNTNNPAVNPLYFELKGTISSPNVSSANSGESSPYYVTLDGSGEIGVKNVPGRFNLAGFVNSGPSATGTDETPAPIDFLKNLKPNEYGPVDEANAPHVMLLACSVGWPQNINPQPVPGNPGLDPWRYVSTHPTNNPASYDLWVDVSIKGKTYRISNWSKEAELVP